MTLFLMSLTAGAEPFRLLCVGNSFSRDAVIKYLYPLYAADGDDILICNLFSPAASLGFALQAFTCDSLYSEAQYVEKGEKRVEKNVRAKDMIALGDWDIVSIQHCSEFSGDYRTYETIPSLVDEIRKATKSNQKIVFHQTWAYADWLNNPAFARYGYSTDTMYNRISGCTSRLKDDYPQIDRIIPSGTAIQTARLNTSTLKKLTVDGVHLDSLGSFTAACTWYESLTGKDCRENSYRPKILSREAAEMAKECAHAAVAKPFEPTVFRNQSPTCRPAGFDLYTSVGILVVRPRTETVSRLTVLSPTGLRIYDAPMSDPVTLRLQSGIYLILIDGTFFRSVLI